MLLDNNFYYVDLKKQVVIDFKTKQSKHLEEISSYCKENSIKPILMVFYDTNVMLDCYNAFKKGELNIEKLVEKNLSI